MLRTQHARKRSRGRLLRLVILGVVLVGAGWGSYELYTLRTKQNTQKVLRRAQEAAAAEDWDNAAIAYRQYLQREPEDVEALQAYSDALLERMKTVPEAVGDAVRTLRRLVGMEPDNTEAVEKLTRLYMGLREHGLAAELATSWTTLDPGSADAALALALSQRRLHKGREASDTLITTIARNPNEPRLYALLVRLLVDELNQPDEAARWLDEALRVGPDAPDVQLAAFAFYESQDELDDAEKHLRRALDLAPDSLDTLLPAGMFYLSHGRLDEAGALLDRAGCIAPKNPSVLSIRALWATQVGSVAALVATADEFLNLAGDGNPGFLVQAAELYLRAGELDRTDECLAKLDSLPHASEQIDTRLDALRGARAFQGGEFYSAINHLRSALRREPSNVWATRLLAAAYAEAGDLDGAADAYQRLIHAAPRNVDARLRLAGLAWQRGRPAEARDAVNTLPGASDAQQHEAELIRFACDLQEAKRNGSQLEKREGWRQELERLASVVPHDAASTRWLMRCFVLAGRLEQAAELLHVHMSDAETGPGLGVELGRLLLSEGLGERALTLADELIKQFPDAAEGHVLRTKALAATGRLSEAVAYADPSSLPAAVRGWVLEALADEHVVAGQIELAMDLYRQAADLMADNVSVRRKLVRQTLDLDEAVMRGEEIRAVEGDTGLHWKFEQAGALLRLDPSAGSLSKARELLKQCLADRPRWPSARLLLGYAHERSGEFQDAVEAYRTAIAQEPNLRAKPVAIRLVGLLNRLGRLAEADALLSSLVTVLPDEPAILRLRTEQQIRERDFDSALATAEHLLELEPDDPAWTVATADLHLRVGNPARAEAIARAALTRLPRSTPILWSLARALMAQHRSAEAEERVRKAVAEANDAPHYLLLAHVLARLDQQSDAEQAIARAQRLAPEDAAVWAACADFWDSVNQWARQVACTRKTIELRGEDPAESLALARLLASSDTAEGLAEAEAIIRRRLEADPDDVPMLILEAKLALSTEPSDLVKAEASLRRALANDPRSTDAHRLLAGVQIRSGEFLAAAEAVAVSLAFVPDDPDLLLSAGELHCFHGEYRKAITPLRRLLEVRPRTPRGVRLLVTAYQETGQVDRAIEFVEALAPQDALTASETLILARLYEVNNDLDRAKVLFLLALRLDEDSSGTFQEVLKFYTRRQDFRRVHTLGSQRRADFPNDVTSLAVAGEILGAQCPDATLRETGMEWLEEIARKHPDRASDALFRTGMCYYQQGDLEKAEDRFLRASRLAPKASGPVVNALAWMYAEDLGRPGDARAVIDRFLAAGGHEDARLLDTHATVLLRLGELDAAREKLAECLKRAGQTSTLAAAHYHLGLVLSEGGGTSEATSYIQRALQLADRLGGLTQKEMDHAERLIADRRSAHDAPRP